MPRDSRLLIVVVTLAACAFGELRSANSSMEHGESLWESAEEGVGSSWRSHRDNLMLLRREGGKDNLPVDCCPSILEMTSPIGGINQKGNYVELYSAGDTKQMFFDLSCRPGVADRPCRFMDRKLHDWSRCVQKYSYTYAIVKREGAEAVENSFAGTGWVLDYIRVRSGCSCEVGPLPKRKRSGRGKKGGSSRGYE